METALIFIACVLMLGILLTWIYVFTLMRQLNRSYQFETPPPKPLFKSKPKEPTEEEIKQQKILANIDAYDGSGKGQIKV